MGSLSSLSNLTNQRPPFFKAMPIYAVNLFLLLLSAATMSFVAIDNVHVIFFMTPLFYWVIHNPFLMPLWFVFLAGLFIDFSIDGFLGLHAFAFVVYYILLYRARRVILSQPILYQMAVYGVSVAFFEALRWAVLSLILWQIWPVFPSMIALTMNIVTFPVIVLVLKLLHRILSGYGRKY